MALATVAVYGDWGRTVATDLLRAMDELSSFDRVSRAPDRQSFARIIGEAYGIGVDDRIIKFLESVRDWISGGDEQPKAAA